MISVPVIANSYMFAHGTRPAAMPRSTAALACSAAPRAIRAMPVRAAGRPVRGAVAAAARADASTSTAVPPRGGLGDGAPLPHEVHLGLRLGGPAGEVERERDEGDRVHGDRRDQQELGDLIERIHHVSSLNAVPRAGCGAEGSSGPDPPDGGVGIGPAAGLAGRFRGSAARWLLREVGDRPGEVRVVAAREAGVLDTSTSSPSSPHLDPHAAPRTSRDVMSPSTASPTNSATRPCDGSWWMSNAAYRVMPSRVTVPRPSGSVLRLADLQLRAGFFDAHDLLHAGGVELVDVLRYARVEPDVALEDLKDSSV